MTTPQKSPAAETWQIGKVTVHRIAEVPLRGFGRWLLPQATSDVVSGSTWLSPFYVDDDGQLLGSVHAFAVQIHTALENDGRGYRADLNEAPFAPPDSVLAVAMNAMSEVNRYPDDRCSELVQALSDRLRVPAPHIAVGAGATAIIQQVLLAAVRHGDEVVCSSPSTDRYPGLIQVAGARLAGVPLDGAHQNLGALAGAVTERTRVMFVGNPSDLTGTTVHRHTLRNFLDRVPPDVLVVIDEEYREFVGEPAAPDGVLLYREHPNVAVIRTFSKAYGLAGLRVGFMIAQPRVIGAVRRTALPFGVSAVAQKAALSALRNQFELRERIGALVRERDRMIRLLGAQGWDVRTVPERASRHAMPGGAPHSELKVRRIERETTGPVARALTDLTAEYDADLLVVGARLRRVDGRPFLGCTIREMLRHRTGKTMAIVALPD